MPAPDFDSDDLLRFARETPFTYGRWRDVKSLYKRLEADPASSPDALAALITRIDSASLAPVYDIPTAALGLGYNTGTPESMAMHGTRMALIAQNWQSSWLYCFDFDTQDPLKPTTVGKMTQKGRADWDEVVFLTENLVCVRISSHQIRLFEIMGNGSLTERGTIRDPSGQAASQRGDVSTGFSILAAAEQMVKNAFGGAMPGAERPLKFANLQSIATDEKYVYVACGATSGRNPSSMGGLFIVDPANPDDLQVAGSISINDAEKVFCVPGRSLVAVLANPANRGRFNSGSLHLIDVSNPQQPEVVSHQALAHGSVLTATEEHLYLSMSNSGGGGSQGIKVIDITNPRAPRTVSTIPSESYYGADHMACDGGFLYASLRYGRIQVIDVRDPHKPVRLRELAPNYIKGLSITGGRLYAATNRSVVLFSMQTPERPTLIGTPPSAATLGYMKRRARRLLKTLAKTDPALFTSIATQVLTEPRKVSGLDWATNWVVVDLLFGEGGRVDQVSHGRGRMVETRPRGLRIRRREERGQAAWDAHPERAGEIFVSSNAPWQAREMTLKVLRSSGHPVPALSGALLLKCLASSSPLLIAEAVRQSVVLAQSNAQMKPELAAEAFAKATPRQRTLLQAAVRIRAEKEADWATAFANALLLRLPDATGSDHPTKRTVAIATTLFEAFGDFVLEGNDNPVLRLIPMLMASGQSLLRDQAVRALHNISPAAAFAWLPQLERVTDPADRERLLTAVEGAVRGLSVPTILEEAIEEILLDDSSTTTAWGWQILAALAPTSEFLKTLWTNLLSDESLDSALQAAMASSHALSLLGRAGITNDEMSGFLQERPQLIGLLSAESFAVVTQTMRAAVTLRMIAAATDEAWATLREGWLRNLREGVGVNALWASIEAALKDDETGNLERRLIEDPEIAATIRDADDVAGILAIREPSLARLLGDYVNHHIDKIAASDVLLLTAATHPLPEVRDPGLAALAKTTIRLPMALALLESEVPASIAAGNRWFAETSHPDHVTRALALCDSPVSSVRAVGRQFAAEHATQIPIDALAEALAEHADPKMQAFVARLLGASPAPQFDREVLRVRNKAREAKELVKERQDALISEGASAGAVDTATLLALARGTSTPRDSEWALTQLVRRALAGETIEGLTIEGTAVAAPGAR